LLDKHNITPKEALQEWLARLKIPRQALDGHSICPFSKGISVPTPEDLNIDNSFRPPALWEIKKIKIYNITNPNITPAELDEWCDYYINKYENYMFIADHKDRDTHINGIKTNNGYFNFMLVQSLPELNEARRNLLKTTNYYSFWDPEYLKDTWNNSFDKEE
jgi:hypothetical protein